MKKLVILMFLLLTVTSCFKESEEDKLVRERLLNSEETIIEEPVTETQELLTSTWETEETQKVWDMLNAIDDFNKDEEKTEVKEETKEDVKKVEDNNIVDNVVLTWSIASTWSTTTVSGSTNSWSLRIWTSKEQIKFVTLSKPEEITCDGDKLKDYLVNNFGYVYWNSCRPATSGSWITYNVLRLKWNEYFYEKHYVSYDKWVYWVGLLEYGKWVTKDTIATENTALKSTDFSDLTKKYNEYYNSKIKE